MSTKYIFAIIGGDRRQAVIADKLLALGHTVRICGLGDFAVKKTGIELFLSVEKAISGCDAVLLPLPVSRDGQSLNMLSVDKKDSPLLSDIVKYTAKNPKPFIIGGLIPKQMRNMADALSVNIADYYESEDLQRKNALPSAEGALMISMENTDRVIRGMKALISGYGRIGKCLADILYKLGADVSVGARRDEVICEIAMSGYNAIKMTDEGKMKNAVNSCDVIFNTVPSVIFTERILSGVKHSPIYVEIASSPGGISLHHARKNGIRIFTAPSLPGRYAPASAGEYIFETIQDILYERGIKI